MRRPSIDELVPIEPDPVIEVYKADIDRALLRENLRLSPTDRVRRLQQAVHTVRLLQQARRRSPLSDHG
jgi:hypothetical protein